jgi:uncharacterized protein YciI
LYVVHAAEQDAVIRLKRNRDVAAPHSAVPEVEALMCAPNLRFLTCCRNGSTFDGGRQSRSLRAGQAVCQALQSAAQLRQACAMFVIELMYKADLAEIDAHMKAHVAFLNKHYAAGTFLISGRKVPRDGGIILAAGKSKPELAAIMAEDPFCKHALAEFRIIEFRASQRAKDIPKRVED